MGGLFDGVAQSYLLGTAIGERVRKVSREHKVRKSVKGYDAALKKIDQATEEGDLHGLTQFTEEAANLATKAYDAVERLNLSEDGYGTKVLGSTISGYTNPAIPNRGDRSMQLPPEAPTPDAKGRTSVTAAPDEYAGHVKSQNYLNKFAQAGGRVIDPKQMEQIGSQAVAKLYGEHLAPAAQRAAQEQKTNGAWSNQTATEIAASLQAMTSYIPGYKGAIVQVTADNKVFIDPTGGEDSDGYLVEDANGIAAEYEKVKSAYAGASSALPTTIAQQEADTAEKKAQQAAVVKSQTAAAQKILEGIGLSPVDALKVTNNSTELAKSGVKVTLLTAEEMEAHKGYKDKVTINGNDYFRTVVDMTPNKTEDKIYQSQFVDAGHNAISPADFKKILDAQGAGTESSLLTLYNLTSAADADRTNKILSVAGTLYNAAVNGEAADLTSMMTEPATITEAAPEGGAAAYSPSNPNPSSDEVDAFIIELESNGNPNAKNKDSSATGPHQFVADTWRKTVTQAKPAWAKGLSDGELQELRTDPTKSNEMYQYLKAQNISGLKHAGVQPTKENIYAAHHFGVDGGIAFGKASLDTPMNKIITPAELAANSYLKGKTKGQALNIWHTRAGSAPDGSSKLAAATTAIPAAKAKANAVASVGDDAPNESGGIANTRIAKVTPSSSGVVGAAKEAGSFLTSPEKQLGALNRVEDFIGRALRLNSKYLQP